MEKQGKTSEENLTRLRQKAEEMQQKIDAQDFGALSSAEARKLVQELHLYQIELEMQNEQLQVVSEELAQSVMKYEDLYEFAPVGYVTLDEYGLVLEANLTVARLLRTDRRLLKDNRLSRLVAPEDFNKFTAYLGQLVASEIKQTCELTFICPDHTVFEARLEGIALLGRSPDKIQCRVAIIDISDQKAAERRERESQDFVQKVADAMPDILMVYDLETMNLVYANGELKAITGLGPEKAAATSPGQLLNLVHPEDQAAFRQNLRAMRQYDNGAINEFEYRLRDASGQWRLFHARNLVFQRSGSGEVTRVLSVQRDLTQQLEMEKALRQKDRIVQGLLSTLPIAVSLISREGTFLQSTGSGLRSAGHAETGETLTGENAFQLFPEIKPFVEEALKGKIAEHINLVANNGQERYFKNYFFYEKESDAVIAFSIDITEQKMAEQEVLAEREFSQNLLDNTTDGILAFDTELRFTAWNKVMEENTPFLREELIGKKLFDKFPLFKDTELGKAAGKVLQGERLVLHDQNFWIDNADYEVYLNPLFDEQGRVTGALCILHNVILQKRLEAETTRLKLKQQKMVLNAILNTQEIERRRIAESLHNGVGQLLYAAKLNLERTARENPQGTKDADDRQKLLAELLDEAIREIRTISFELMPRILEDFGLETAVSELISRLCRSGMDLKYEVTGLPRFSPLIEISAYRIIQELLNNIIKHSQATEASLELVLRRNVLCIIAKDNGVGFDAEETAARHQGIGLTGIRNRVKLLEGKIDIAATPGQGTTIEVKVKTN